MKTQSDSRERVVNVPNLEAMCERVSGMCHRFWVEQVSRSRVTVGYSNPDEYGAESPMFAVFPCYPNDRDGVDNPFVVLTYLRVLKDNWQGEGWQAFEILRDCPVLWRDPMTNKWSTDDEIKREQAKAVQS